MLLLFLLFSSKSKYFSLIQQYIEKISKFFVCQESSRALDSKSFQSAEKEILTSHLCGFYILIKWGHLRDQIKYSVYVVLKHPVQWNLFWPIVEYQIVDTLEQKDSISKGSHWEKHGILSSVLLLMNWLFRVGCSILKFPQISQIFVKGKRLGTQTG